MSRETSPSSVLTAASPAQRPARVPPSPALMARLRARYNELVRTGRLPETTSLESFLAVWASGRRKDRSRGLDDGRVLPEKRVGGPELIDRPAVPLRGPIQTLVLLVDFPDQPHDPERTPALYEQMLFGAKGVFPSGSMREFYHSVSGWDPVRKRGIDVQGAVHGWFRMPRNASYYTAHASGMGEVFPQNAAGMAADAVRVALAEGVDFSAYDVLGQKTVTGLFIVHAGRGAEETGSRDDFWSLKWYIPGGVDVGSGLTASTFLTVPEDCQMGVCAHEWGHLVAQWADYYDTGRNRNTRSAGLGNFCLMGSGSWGNGGMTPVFPNGMLRMFHGWIEPEVITQSRAGVRLRSATEGGSIAILQNPQRMKEHQYVVAEYRRRTGQDAFLPDEGVAIYVVDEMIKDVNDEHRLAIELMQADGKRHLAGIFGTGNPGDEEDLYPSGTVVTVGSDTVPQLALPDGGSCGMEITVRGVPGADEITFDVVMS